MVPNIPLCLWSYSNGPLAPKLRQRWCSLMYYMYVNLTCIDDGDEQILHVQSGTGLKYLEYNPDQNWIFFSEQWTMNNRIEWKQKSNKMNKSRTTIINEQQYKIIHNITGTWALYATWINHKCLINIGWNVTVQALHRFKVKDYSHDILLK
jgi:hypothetical protein